MFGSYGISAGIKRKETSPAGNEILWGVVGPTIVSFSRVRNGSGFSQVSAHQPNQCSLPCLIPLTPRRSCHHGTDVMVAT